jgi:AcrR family transcriptional regulator
MTLSRQDPPLKKGTRSNQKARTRSALLQAATDLFREGKSPSMPEAADRALVSVATAYRYFSSAEDLWWEATLADVFQQTVNETIERTNAAGSEPQARLEAAVRSNGFAMIDDQAPFRRVAQIALEQWFRRRAAPDDQQIPIRAGRRNELIREVLRPLAGALPEHDCERIANALGLVIGTEAMIALTDAVGLDAPTAKEALLDASRWLLAGALGELTESLAPNR